MRALLLGRPHLPTGTSRQACDAGAAVRNSRTAATRYAEYPAGRQPSPEPQNMGWSRAALLLGAPGCEHYSRPGGELTIGHGELRGGATGASGSANIHFGSPREARRTVRPALSPEHSEPSGVGMAVGGDSSSASHGGDVGMDAAFSLGRRFVTRDDGGAGNRVNHVAERTAGRRSGASCCAARARGRARGQPSTPPRSAPLRTAVPIAG